MRKGFSIGGLVACVVVVVLLLGRGDPGAPSPPAAPRATREAPIPPPPGVPDPAPVADPAPTPRPEAPAENVQLAPTESLLPPSVLRVRAADTGRELRDVVVVRSDDWQSEDRPHPGDVAPKEVVFASAASPITLPADHASSPVILRTWHVRAPGYAWGRIRIDHRTGGERRIDLVPGGGVDVTLTGGDRDPGTRLRLRPADAPRASPVAEFDATRRERIGIEGLAAGHYMVSAEIGDSWRDSVVLATGEVEVVAGQRAFVTLELSAAEKPEFVPLAGVIVVPEEWEIVILILSVEIRDTPFAGQDEYVWLRPGAGLEQDLGNPGLWRFDAGRMQAGKYRLRVSPPEFEQMIELAPPGDRDVRILVPPPGSVIVRVLAAATGEDADIEDLIWHGRRPGDGGGGSLHSAKRNEKTGRWEFRAPQGEVEISVWADGYEPIDETLTVGPGTTETTIRVRPLGGVRLTFRDGEARVPFDWDWSVEFEPIAGEGRVACASSGGEDVLFQLSEPGRYRVRIPEIEGFLPVPVFTVDVETGKIVDRVVRLERER